MWVTLQNLLDDLDIIESFQQPGSKRIIGEVTKKQQEIYGLLNVEDLS